MSGVSGRRLPLGIISTTSVVAGAAALLVATNAVNVPAYDRAFELPWWVLAAMFCLTEMHVIHVQFKRETQTFSLNELPLILALFFASPIALITGQLVGAAVALIAHRRQSAVKWTFNLSHFALSTMVASITFRAIAHEGEGFMGSMEIVASFAAVTLALFVGNAAVMTAIWVIDGRPTPRFIARSLSFGTIGAATNACIALSAVVLLRDDPASAWLLAVPSAVLYLAYRGYTQSRMKHETLASLSEVTRAVQMSSAVEPAMRTVLDQARRLMRAEVATITFLPLEGESAALEAHLAQDHDMESLTAIELDPTQGVWARVVAEGQGILLARPIENARLRAYFATLGMRDAIVAPLWGRDRIIGFVRVGNRSGDVETFSTDDLLLFETFVRHVGVALENARLLSHLQHSLGDLQLMDRLKDEVLATLSHELRSPLASLRLHIEEMIQTEEASTAEGNDHLRVMAAQSERLRGIIEDLLTDARLGSGAVASFPSKTHIPELLARVVESAAMWHPKHVISIDGLSEDVLPVYSDRDIIASILNNLVSNACKYSPEGSHVTLWGTEVDEGVKISVSDQGRGIPAELHARVFDRFFRSASKTTKAPGVGLGLSICTRLAGIIGGHVTLDHSEPGRGSTFSLWVPVRVVDEPAQGQPSLVIVDDHTQGTTAASTLPSSGM